jgi:AbrB family looped-hinge helix DNA binding protein
MKNISYSLKVSPQSQVTLPKGLREQLQLKPGSRVTVTVAGNGNMQLSDKLPIKKHFGSLANVWTENGQDAAEYSRDLRKSMQPKLKSD